MKTQVDQNIDAFFSEPEPDSEETPSDSGEADVLRVPSGRVVLWRASRGYASGRAWSVAFGRRQALAWASIASAVIGVLTVVFRAASEVDPWLLVLAGYFIFGIIAGRVALRGARGWLTMNALFWAVQVPVLLSTLDASYLVASPVGFVAYATESWKFGVVARFGGSIVIDSLTGMAGAGVNLVALIVLLECFRVFRIEMASAPDEPK